MPQCFPLFLIRWMCWFVTPVAPQYTRRGTCLTALILIVATCAFGQIYDLAATDDGAQIYFVSPLRQKGTDQFLYAKLFRITETGALELFDQFERRYPEGRPNTSNYYAPAAPSISGDGTVVAYSLLRDCQGGSSCVFVERARGAVRTATTPSPLSPAGQTQVSNNGRFVAESESIGVFPYLRLTDLRTGEQTRVEGRRAFLSRTQAVTDDGHVLVYEDGSAVLWGAGGSQPIPTIGPTSEGVVSHDGTIVIYRTSEGSLRAVNLRTRVDMLVGVGTAPVLSADGRFVLYLAPSHPGAPVQAWLGHTDGSEPRRLTALADDVVSATLTGFANAAFVSTNVGRLLRIDLPSGDVRELIPRTPVAQTRRGATVPGSMNWLYGSGLREVASISLATLEVPILSKEESAVAYQIPFEAPLQRLELHVEPNPSPLEGPPLMVPLEALDPQFIYYGSEIPAPPELGFGVAAVHEDFQSVVTDASPARPDEILHLYMTGLGAVEPAVETGRPAPLDKVIRARAVPDCRWFERPGIAAPIEVVFAGLAPGMTGIYQVSMRMPANPQPFDTNPSRSAVVIQCGSGGNVSAYIPMIPKPQ